MDFEASLPYIAGVIGIPVINWLKGALDISGKPVLVLSVVVSGLLAVGAAYFFGDGFDLLNDGAKAFAAATVIYKLLPDS